MALIGGLLLVLFIGGACAYVGHVYGHAKAAGAFSVLPKASAGKGRTARARTQARQAPAKARIIVTQAVTDNWLAKRAHVRENGKPPRSLGRLARISPPGNPAPPASAKPAATPRPAPVPQSPPTQPSPGGSTMTATTTANGTSSAASDFFSALARVIAGARAGGIRAKAHAHLVMTEGFNQQASALEQHAKELQEQGQYPPHVWEPVMQGAGMLRAAAMKLTESANSVATIAKTPAGELAGQAPHRDELNKA